MVLLSGNTANRGKTKKIFPELTFKKSREESEKKMKRK
jgi:hypothetical protein